ncbi:TlpA disulfide reductase family protein [Terrabacter sp. NPDC000476]|uniref:TlpA family protein disulfide reductase n=1 Tax=Terrabacter sp. NPDC000476 TaxID=3154258 RepID=UPI00333236F2
MVSDAAPLTRRRALQLATSLVAAGGTALLAGCGAEQSAADQARSGDRKGYVSGDGTIEQIPPGSRRDPVRLSGTTLEGRPWSNADLRATVLVVNVWGSWCPPCISEAADLQKAWESVQRRRLPVRFLGLDKMETPATGLSFQRQHRITYPSLAYDGGVPILALQGKAVATPTTLVLDTSARIAARVSGPVTASVLTGLIDDVLSKG